VAVDRDGQAEVAAEQGGVVVGAEDAALLEDRDHLVDDASSFTSVSLDPPLVSVSIARTSATWPILRGAPRIGLSVLAAHHDAVCRQLAGPVDLRFDGLDLVRPESGALLIDEAAATFECTVLEELPAGDHLVVLLELHEVNAVEHASPLVFHRSQFGRLHGHGIEPSRRVTS
jgi:flavin reductase (DIM6/NTAB) family NADH-FMN oxidoreductase RutF